MEQDAVRQNLLDRLLDGVKQCQVYYGAGQEIAVEVEPRVSTLCTEWEAVLTHGLYRAKERGNLVRPASQQSKDSASCLWPLAKLCISPEEEAHFLSLSHVKTDVGRGRAWLRKALNERTMERYLHSIASQEEALRSMYEPTAFLLDQDRASTLPNMAAGLSSVAFAINFDAMYLDSPRRFVDVFSGTVFLSPPATSDPTPAGGDDDEDEVVAVRVPKEKKKETHRRRASSPGLPYPAGPPQTKVSPTQPSLATPNVPPTSVAPPTAAVAVPTLVPVTEGGGITEPPSSPNISKVMETVQSTRRLLVASQLSEQKQTAPNNGLNSDELREALLMMMKSRDEVAETNRQLERKLSAEVASREQLSAELEALKAQQQMSHTSMQSLERENDRLHEQLQKYMGIVQTKRKESVLNRSTDSGEAVAVDRSSLVVEPDPVESSLEQQLCNMAQMYGEVMEFNERLQKDVAAKESIILSLKASMRSKGIEVPIPDQPKAAKKTLEVSIPYVVRKEENSDSYHTYQVRVKVGNEEWSINRRYAEFREFHSQLEKVLPDIGFFEFPPKRTLGNKSVQVVEERRQRLQEYLKYVFYTCCTTFISRGKGRAPEPVLNDKTVTKNDLIEVLPFFKEDEATLPELNPSPTYSGL